MILVRTLMRYESQLVLDQGGKKSHLQIVSSFVSGTAPQLPSEQVLFIHADKVTYS